jgi:hypothetical protein
MDIRTVYCIGNPHIPEDRLALDLADQMTIDGVQFIKVLSPEELFSEHPTALTIMDCAKGISKVTVFTDLSKLKSGHLLSLHDFDLSMVLQLMEGMGTLPKLTIIALPMGKSVDEVESVVREVLMGLGGKDKEEKEAEEDREEDDE